jgi:hypothetical protein
MRFIFAMNSLYRFTTGLIALINPTGMALFFGGAGPSAQNALVHNILRFAGAYLLLTAGISAMIAFRPYRYPFLLPLMALLGFFTLLCNFIAWLSRELPLDIAVMEGIMQGIIIVTVLLYYREIRGLPSHEGKIEHKS